MQDDLHVFRAHGDDRTALRRAGRHPLDGDGCGELDDPGRQIGDEKAALGVGEGLLPRKGIRAGILAPHRPDLRPGDDGALLIAHHPAHAPPVRAAEDHGGIHGRVRKQAGRRPPVRRGDRARGSRPSRGPGRKRDGARSSIRTRSSLPWIGRKDAAPCSGCPGTVSSTRTSVPSAGTWPASFSRSVAFVSRGIRTDTSPSVGSTKRRLSRCPTARTSTTNNSAPAEPRTSKRPGIGHGRDRSAICVQGSIEIVAPWIGAPRSSVTTPRMRRASPGGGTRTARLAGASDAGVAPGPRSRPSAGPASARPPRGAAGPPRAPGPRVRDRRATGLAHARGRWPRRPARRRSPARGRGGGDDVLLRRGPHGPPPRPPAATCARTAPSVSPGAVRTRASSGAAFRPVGGFSQRPRQSSPPASPGFGAGGGPVFSSASSTRTHVSTSSGSSSIARWSRRLPSASASSPLPDFTRLPSAV